MPKVLFIILLLSSLFVPANVAAREGGPESCNPTYAGYVVSSKFPDRALTNQDIDVEVTFDLHKADPNFQYFISITNDGIPPANNFRNSNTNQIQPNQPTLKFNVAKMEEENTGYKVKLKRKTGSMPWDEEDICVLGKIVVYREDITKAACTIQMPADIQNGSSFSIQTTLNPVDNIEYHFAIFRKGDATIIPSGVVTTNDPFQKPPIDPDKAIYNVTIKTATANIDYKNDDSIQYKKLSSGNYVATMWAYKSAPFGWWLIVGGDVPLFFYCDTKQPIAVTDTTTSPPSSGSPKRPPGAPTPTGGLPSGLPKAGGTIPNNSAAGGLCDYDFSIGTFTAKSDLINNRNEAGLRTAIGCVPTKLTDLIAAILKFSLSIGGGIAFLLMVSGVFQIMTSAGNPDQLKNGSSMITNAIIGILFIIFSILFLQIIGTGILQIRGLS